MPDQNKEPEAMEVAKQIADQFAPGCEAGIARIIQHHPQAHESEQVRVLREALNRLIELKKWKDANGKDAFYEQQQPMALRFAEEALASLPKGAGT